MGALLRRSPSHGRPDRGPPAQTGEFDELRGFRIFDRVEEWLVTELLASCSSRQFRPGEIVVEQDGLSAVAQEKDRPSE